MVVVLSGDILGQLEASVFVGGDDPMHHTHRLEQREIPVDRRLRQGSIPFEQLVDGGRGISGGEQLDDGLSAAGVALRRVGQSMAGRIVSFSDRVYTCHGRSP